MKPQVASIVQQYAKLLEKRIKKQNQCAMNKEIIKYDEAIDMQGSNQSPCDVQAWNVVGILAKVKKRIVNLEKECDT